MIKRKLSLFLALIMLIGILPINGFAASPSKYETVYEKSYEEKIIDGKPYKVYNIGDLIDRSQELSPNLFKKMTKSTALPQKQETPIQASTIKFVLELRWSTYDRPIDNVTIPVYVGDPSNPKSIKLGHFEVNSTASPGVVQNFNMINEYNGPASIEDLVKYAYANFRLAIPNDMRYDFILAPAKWDSKQKNGDVFKFVIEAKQSVMHGYGIKWFDNDKSNREKIEAKWEGRANQTSDKIKLGTEDRDYSVYINNVIDTNDKNNVKSYPDGTTYSNYVYYYNGKAISTLR